MPPAGEALDDDYVISLLKKDAESNQKRYLTTGLGSLLNTKPRGNVPKPNTRFLRNILKETDSHNAALKAKEEQESKNRLKEWRAQRTGAKRSRDEQNVDEDPGSSKRRKGDNKPGRWARAFDGLGNGSRGFGTGFRDQQHASAGAEDGKDHKPRDSNREKRSRHRDIRDSGHRDRQRHVSSGSSRSRSPQHRKTSRRRSRSPQARHSHQSRVGAEDERDVAYASDTDSLDDLIGPRPDNASKPRGRGAAKSSNMDSRFAATYNPKEDVNLDPDEDGDDWDMALEALRDRAKWRTKGAERLRAAGFTDEEVKKWEKGGEKDIEDVKWSKKGERREWDRGKVVADSGDVSLKPEWGRLKGT